MLFITYLFIYEHVAHMSTWKNRCTYLFVLKELKEKKNYIKYYMLLSKVSQLDTETYIKMYDEKTSMKKELCYKTVRLCAIKSWFHELL